MKQILILAFIVLAIISNAQNNIETYEITYSSGDNSINVYYQNDILFLSGPKSKIVQYSNFKDAVNISLLKTEDSIYKRSVPFAELSKPLKIEEKTTETILGYKCKYAEYSYFSNKIELWYTEKADLKGSLYSSYLPSANSLVLKIKVNGGDRVKATAIRKLDTIAFDYLANDAIEVNKSRFEELKINSRFTVLQIFDNEQINWDPSIELPEINNLKADITYHFRNGTVLLKKIKIGDELKANNYVFAKLNSRSNGDAYDRTGSVFIIPASHNLTALNTYFENSSILPPYICNNSDTLSGIIATDNYEPAIEVMRFFTSFGTDYFNDKRPINNYPWTNDVVYKQDISSLIPNAEDEIWVGVYIGNYDKGGHKVSLEFDIYPSFEKDSVHKMFVKPLFSTVNIIQPSKYNYGRIFKTDTLVVDFSIDEDLQNLKLLYTSTGHGGWGEGDEFVPRFNQILLDGEVLFSVTPWRTDCATYRFSNPASGNFGNGLSSSDLSRSNWCPGTLTPPYVIPLKNLEKGQHKMKIIIEFGPETENGRNSWNVSGILTGEYR